MIHSNSYTHFRDVNNVLSFFGSVSENLGYTYFKGDFNNNNLGIYKDVLGKKMEANQEIDFIRVFMAQGIEAEAPIWDTYAEFYEDKRAIKNNEDDRRHVNGWTSWYNYYGDVSESIINENVEALQKHKYPINIFQIDDGFQTAIGDWLSINNKFPNGMKVVADKIKSARFKAGLWLAPYAVGFTSRIVKEHPDWLIMDPDTKKPVIAGPNWGGFYALDMYHPDARKYLRHVFDTVLQDWGFDMVKLDFCFAAAMIPRLGKPRGEIMWDAMEFIRELVGPEKLVLGCGVPLASAFRKVDYCRIGSDVAPWWEGLFLFPITQFSCIILIHALLNVDNKLKMLNVRERVSTANSLVSTLSRWTMSDRMFGNDPDVMILRNLNNKLSADERYTLCVLNNILGALVFSSDNVSLYGRDEHLLYSATFPKVVSHVFSVLEFKHNCYMIRFVVLDRNGKPRQYTTYTNLTADEQTIYLPESSPATHLLFATDNDMHMSQADEEEHLFYHPSSACRLKIHETKTFLHIPQQTTTKEKKNKLLLLGSTSHIVPGVELDQFEQDEITGEIKVSFRQENTRHHKVFAGFGTYLYENRSHAPPVFKINGVQAKHEWIPVAGVGEGRPKSEVLSFVIEEF